jgi:16S rRNA (cytosine967-C5)-methyltransferase
MSDFEKSPTPAGLCSRRAALDLAERVRGGQAFDEALQDCRSFAALDGPDRAFARALAATALRRRGSLDHVLGAYVERPFPKKAARAMDILRLAGAQILFMGTPAHAAVSTAVALARERRETGGYAKLINAVARKLASAGPGRLEKVPLRADTPGWLWRSWERAYGPRAVRAVAEIHRAEPPLDLTLKDAGAAMMWAERLGAEILPTGSLRLAGSHHVAALPGFDDGAWWVQDAAASLPAKLLGDVAQKRVIDLCAAPGGKTLQLAAAGARVTAVEKSASRARRLSENLARTGLAADIVIDDALRWKSAQKADAVLLDAPCSATGTIRRHPDIAWSKSEADIAALAHLQAELMDCAAQMARPGGVLVYCVCSLQPEEGEDQAAAAAARHPTLQAAPIGPEEIGAMAQAINANGQLRTLPSFLADKGGMDGFFAARWFNGPARFEK